MLEQSAFLIEESDSISGVTHKTTADKAIYSGKFSEYIVTKSKLIKESLVVTDMLNDRDGVDIINSSIKELIFSDCVKKFSEIYSNFIELKEVQESNLDNQFKFSITEEDSENFIYRFKEAIDIPFYSVRSIKIFINGYNEISESINFDLDLLRDESRYKYKITSNTIEIIILTNLTASLTKEFLKTFTYKKMDSSCSEIKEIYIIINDILIYKTEIEI
ncbi:hypothetical protein CDOMF_0534 [Campylobacter sp. RM16187]|nr:hypothetical protein CDOMF_0534 [Campylobacter sp. RM16187]